MIVRPVVAALVMAMVLAVACAAQESAPQTTECAIRIGNYASAGMLVSAGVRNLRSR
jgi:hypothetical protein